jgi:DNA polymerase-1
MGDSVDNIPGFPGVGEKTAKKFLKEYGSLENLLSNSPLIPGKLGEKITNNKELGIISKELAKIILNVPIDYNLKDFKLTEPNKEKVLEVFDELEFRRIKETFFKIYGTERQTDNSADKQVSIQTNLFDQNNYNQDSYNKSNLSSLNSQYQFIDNVEELKLFTNKVMKQSIVSFDTETENLNSLETKLVGISFSWEKHTGYFVSFSNEKEKNTEFIELLKPFFESNKIEKVGHNLKFDIKVLFKYGINVCAPIYDTMIAHYIINPDMRHNLDSLSESYLNFSPFCQLSLQLILENN